MSKKITMTDIAKEVGVSQTLVSFVLSGKNDMGISTDTKTRVLNTARRLGYCSNAASQMLKLGRSGCIVLCFTDAQKDISAEFLGAVCKSLRKFGYELIIHFPDEASDSEHCIQLVKDGKADGVLLYGENGILREKLNNADVNVEVLSGKDIDSDAESAEKLCKVILDCTDTSSERKGSVGKKRISKTTAAKRKKTEAKAKVTVSETAKPEPESEKPARKQESIWLL